MLLANVLYVPGTVIGFINVALLILIQCSLTRGKPNNTCLSQTSIDTNNNKNYCSACSWNFVKNDSVYLLDSSSYQNGTFAKSYWVFNNNSLPHNLCALEGGLCHVLHQGLICSKDGLELNPYFKINSKESFPAAFLKQNFMLKASLIQLFNSFSNKQVQSLPVLKVSKLMFKIVSTLVNEVKQPLTTPCSNIKAIIIWLLLSSDTLIDYFNSFSISKEIITKSYFDSKNIHSFSYRILFVFNNIHKLIAKCFTPSLKETMIQTKSTFLWFKVNNPFRFNNHSYVLKNQKAFFRISKRLQTYLASENRNLSVHFMVTENLFWLEPKNSGRPMVKNPILLSITGRNGREIKNLSVPIDLFFRNYLKEENNSVTKGVFNFSFASNTNLLEDDKLVSIFRLEPLHFPGPGKIIIKFCKISNNSLKVLISENTPPSWKDMNRKGQTVSADFPLYKVSLKNQTKDCVNYLGVTPKNPKAGVVVEYSFETRNIQCYYRVKNSWKTNGCKVGNQTNDTLTHCRCWHLSLFGGSNIITPRKFDLKEDLKLIGNIKDSPMTTIVVVSILLLYLMALVWTRHNDSKDRLQRFVIVQDDNFPGEDQPYLITVFTGLWIGAGTDANIGIRLYGSKGMSRIHNLQSSSQRKCLKANCDDWFLIFTQKSIGEIEKIHIFSDYSGHSPDWYCKKIMVYDLEGEKDFKFIVEKWISLAEEDDCVNLYCYPVSTKKTIRRDRILLDNVAFGLWETHLLLSIFSRHPRSSVTRSQRLSILVGMLLVKLVTSIMFYELEHNDSPEYSEIKRRYIIEMESTLLHSPFIFIVIFCFKKSRIVTAPKNDVPMTLTSTQAVPLETGLEVNQEKRPGHNKNFGLKEHESFSSPAQNLMLKKEGENSIEEEEEEQDFDDEEVDEEEDLEEIEEEEEPDEVDEGCWISCYKQIKALLFQVIPNKTVMPVKIAEEDEESAKVRKKWMYFAWLLCETAIFCSAFTIIMYSLKMESDNRKIWLLKGIKSSLQNIFFLAPVKILIFASVLAILYGQLHYIPSYECNTEAATKRRLAGNKQFLSKMLLMRRNRCYKPLSSNHTKTIRLKEKNWRRWRICISFIVLLLMYIVLIVEVLLTWHGFYIPEGTHMLQAFDPQLNNRMITSFKFYVEYLKKVVLPRYDKRKWYNGKSSMSERIWKQEMGFLIDDNTRLMGVPQLRQQRVKPDSCSVNKLMSDKVMVQCNAPVSWISIDKKDYAFNWTQPEKLISNPNSEWMFSDPKTSPMFICGYKTANCYPPGGYIVKLSYNKSSSEAIIDKLMKSAWFDGRTRVVFLEMVTYNVNSNFLCFVVPMLEKLAVGSFHTQVQTIILHPQSSDFAVTTSIMLFFTSYYLLRIILLFNRKGLKYLLSWTGLLDVFLNVLLYMTMICVYLYKVARTDYLHQWQLDGEQDLQITKDVFLYRDLLRYATAVLVVLIPMQLLHNFRFGKRFFVYFQICSSSFKLCLGLAFVVVFSFFAVQLISVINNSKPVYCFFTRSYNSVTYCSAVYSLSAKLGPLNWLFWLVLDVTALLACVAVLYCYKWVKQRSKYMDDFNMAVFIFGKLKNAVRKLERKIFGARKKITSFTNQRLRAGADEPIDNNETDKVDIFPENKSVSYTKQICKDLNMKIDGIVEKLLDFEKSL